MLLLHLAACLLITDEEIAEKEAAWEEALLLLDQDHDGFAASVDCDDQDAEVHPGATELPNQRDDDCDGRQDNGTILGDDDGDGYCEVAPCAPDPSREDPVLPGDCDDTQPSVYPGAEELCDGQMNDCLRGADEFADLDGDSFSIAQGDPDDRERAIQPTTVSANLAAITCNIARIEPDTFTMGAAERWSFANEAPLHEVTLTRPYLMMATEFTRKQWQDVYPDRAWVSPECGGSCPATRVGWREALDVANALNDQLGLARCLEGDDPYTCEGWRLPTEAEWEHAARGDSLDRYAGSTNPALVGWTFENSGDVVHPAGVKAPNAAGLYDMTGNVWEWVWDLDQFYGADPVTDPLLVDPIDPPDATDRGLRGGSGHASPDTCHVTVRSALPPDDSFWADHGDAADYASTNPLNWIGFRLVRTAP
ncbi:MAG: SUMF1/EgtB/PvdO family nonheme iron enzyme [Deltaproteobacteria bacterium]|nr:SUMF1/EgtB/PvdO family nonheme iron enzyme [Deltaproteobacteria bacterium]